MSGLVRRIPLAVLKRGVQDPSLGRTSASLLNHVRYGETSSPLSSLTPVHFHGNQCYTQANVSGNVISQRSYVSRAHPKPTPGFHIFDAVDNLLSDAAERREKRQTKWDQKHPERKAKWEAANPGQTYPDEGPYRNVDETFELVVGLNLDPRRADQILRGSMPLKHGTGGTPVRVAVFTSDANAAAAALEAGATLAGGEELVQQIKDGTVAVTDMDRAVASADMQPRLASIGRMLGPRGLMPNPKMGTLLPKPEELAGAVQRQLAGLLEYRVDKYGSLHAAPLGKVSFGSKKLLDHVRAVMMELVDKKPEGAPKGKYLLRCYVSTQQGKSYKVDMATVDPGSVFFMHRPSTSSDATPVAA